MTNDVLLGYSTGLWRGKPHFQCLQCGFDSFDESRMTAHQSTHPARHAPELAMSLEDWVLQERPKQLLCGGPLINRPAKILLGLTTWNSKSASVPAAVVLQQERDRLIAMGAECRIMWIDNGSIDGTAQAVDEILDGQCYRLLMEYNSGQSHSRNLIARYSQEHGADFTGFIDGDIEVIPYSYYAMAEFLLRRGGVHVIGFSPYNFSPDCGPKVSKSCRYVHDWMIARKEYTTCLTQFGLFRTSMFQTCQFEESGPFFGSGWGAEDDEFYIQMVTNGMTMAKVEYHNYIHRGAHTSVGRLGPEQVIANFDARKRFIRDKWAGNRIAKPYVDRILATNIRQFAHAMGDQVKRESQATVDSPAAT